MSFSTYFTRQWFKCVFVWSLHLNALCENRINCSNWERGWSVENFNLKSPTGPWKMHSQTKILYLLNEKRNSELDAKHIWTHTLELWNIVDECCLTWISAADIKINNDRSLLEHKMQATTCHFFSLSSFYWAAVCIVNSPSNRKK